MNYYNQILNNSERQLLPADDADREIERLNGIIAALKAANAELQAVLRKSVRDQN